MLDLRYKDDERIEVGVDEAGRGCLWGPLMAGACVWPAESTWTDEIRKVAEQIKDSKKIPGKRRKVLMEQIKKYAIVWGVGTVMPEEVDSLGATRANQTAFRRAIEKLEGLPQEEGSVRLCVDGILPVYSCEHNEICETIIDGDAKLLSIAAASILAKEAHDDWVRAWCSENTEVAERYDLMSCKGYGTAKHRAGILKHGYLETHRRLYLRKLVPGIVVQRCQLLGDDEE